MKEVFGIHLININKSPIEELKNSAPLFLYEDEQEAQNWCNEHNHNLEEEGQKYVTRWYLVTPTSSPGQQNLFWTPQGVSLEKRMLTETDVMNVKAFFKRFQK